MTGMMSAVHTELQVTTALDNTGHITTLTGLWYATYSMEQLIQVAQLSQRVCAAGWVSYGQKWKTRTGVQYLWTL